MKPAPVNAAPGLKAITIINPDSQAAASGPILRVHPGAMVTIESPVAGGVGQPMQVSGWAVDGAATSGTGMDAVHVYAHPAAGSPVFLGAATYGVSRPDIGASLGSRFTVFASYPRGLEEGGAGIENLVGSVRQ